MVFLIQFNHERGGSTEMHLSYTEMRECKIHEAIIAVSRIQASMLVLLQSHTCMVDGMGAGPSKLTV